jgi:hypothetical protein
MTTTLPPATIAILEKTVVESGIDRERPREGGSRASSTDRDPSGAAHSEGGSGDRAV